MNAMHNYNYAGMLTLNLDTLDELLCLCGFIYVFQLVVFINYCPLL